MASEAESPASGTVTGARVPWIDAGRGASMILVTIFHATFVVEAAVGEGGIWPAINSALLPVRMPLFFFISGMLAADAVTKPLRETRRRSLGLVYLYLLWTVLPYLHMLVTRLPAGLPIPDAWFTFLHLIYPTGPWFLWALVFYFVASHILIRLLGRRSIWAAAALLALAIAAPSVGEATHGLTDPVFGALFFGAVCANFIWFYLGLHLRSCAFRLVASVSWPKALTAVAVYALIYAFALAADVTSEARWLLSAFALAAALMLLALPAYDGWFGRTLVAVGKRTLPIYVAQWLLMELLGLTIVDFALLDGIGEPALVASIATPAFGIAIVAIIWWASGYVLRSPLRWLFAAPSWATGTRSRSVSLDAEGHLPSRARH